MCEIACDACVGVLGSLVRPHPADCCPLRHSAYCGLCAAYGHAPADCPDVLTQAFREPRFMEQLIPPTLLEQFQIKTRTPLAHLPPLEEVGPRMMEVPETEEALRAALTAAGVKPMICQEKGKKDKKEITENKKRLQKVADAAGKKLVFIPPPPTDPPLEKTEASSKEGHGNKAPAGSNKTARTVGAARKKPAVAPAAAQA